MVGVDLADMMVALYRTPSKSHWWYLCLFWQMADITNNNGWLLYRRDARSVGVQKHKKLQEFRLEIADALIHSEKKKGRPSKGGEENVHSPTLYTLDGQPVKSVTELKFDSCYVAVSKGKFKPVQYFSKKCDGNKCKEKLFVQAVRHKEDIKPVVQTKTEATGKNERNPKIEYFTIDVFTNGEPLIPSVTVKIPKTALKSMDNVCSVVGSMMCSHAGVKRLYTLDGQLVKDPQDLKNDGKYVAVTRGRFKPADYFQPV
ncbi:doublecortin domain-containing protein 2C-like [Thalassophryne amazonica]|uniref:doublecortin domain-containing protein 2C-like n=1 Tax=Thalassophryne amazonica TaxID=390379 RepID=UPI001470AE89|nr:doublecortin domain-containing protein 2C-like [Thalassophryne amazonica]